MELVKNLTRENGLDEVSLTSTTTSEQPTVMAQWAQSDNPFRSSVGRVEWNVTG